MLKRSCYNNIILGGLFVHGGSENSIVNNVFYRSSNVTMPGPGQYGHCDGSQGLLLGNMGPPWPTTRCTFAQKRSMYHNIASKMIAKDLEVSS